MKTIKMIVELTYDNEVMHGDEQKSIDWFTNDILLNPEEPLILHSNDIGDVVGTIKIMNFISNDVGQERYIKTVYDMAQRPGDRKWG